MKRVFFRNLVPLLIIGATALVACYYFLNFIASNNLDIAKDKFQSFNEEKQRELIIRNQIAEIKTANAALKVKWENLIGSINALNLLDYKKNTFGRTVYDLIFNKGILTQVFIVENSAKGSDMVYGGFQQKGVHLRNHPAVKRKVNDKLDFDDEILIMNDKTFILICLPYYTGKLITVFDLDYFKDELSTANHDNQFIFLLSETDEIIKHSDLKERTVEDMQAQIKPYMDSIRINNRGAELREHLAVVYPIFDNKSLLLFSENAIENDTSFKESMAIFDQIFTENKNDTFKDLIYWLIAISFMTLLLGLYFAYNTSKPIWQLKSKIKQIQEGDFSARLEYKVNNELDDVADSFNSMVDEIQANKEALIEERDKVIQNKLKLEESNKLLENFAYLVSHDLKQPIRNVSSFSSLLAKNASLSESELEYIRYIKEGCAEMSSIVNGFLNFSTVSNITNNEWELVNLNDVIQKAIKNNETLISESKCIINIDTLPSVTGDRVQLISLFQNIIANAIKYTEKIPEVNITSVTIDHQHHISIQDNGVGISQEDFSEIFNLFSRIKRTDQTGHGIGLALCKKIVELHKGQIDLSSTLHEGSVFTIILPMTENKPVSV